MRLMTIAGTRPEIIRLSRIIPLLDQHFDHRFVYTGQNYSSQLSDVFFRELGVRAPDVNLRVDTSTFGRQLATLFDAFERELDSFAPEQVLILGDTNSALVAFNCKRRGIPVYHMEAGNRCFDDRVPEEVNRRVIDHCSAVLLPYTERSAENLVREGVPRHRVFVTGNPIYEVLEHYMPRIEASNALEKHGVRKQEYALATIHRAENTDNSEIFASLISSLEFAADALSMPVILSVHPRIAERLSKLAVDPERIRAVDAMPFFEFVKLEKSARVVLTDSGTVQEECAIFRVPAITLRDSSERPETVERGSNIVSSTSPDRIAMAVSSVADAPREGKWRAPDEYEWPEVSRTVLNILLSSPRWAAGRS